MPSPTAVSGCAAAAVTQVIVSALFFGVLHAIWGVRGGARAGVSAVLSTTFLALMLGVVFLASHRAVLPCIAAHFALNVVLEPWLVYAYALRARAPVDPRDATSAAGI